MATVDYLAVNKALWNERTKHHLSSDFYNQAAFEAGEDSLKPIELELLGDITGLNVAHVQCHFGQDSLSLARRGAQVTGIDFSEEAIATAKRLATLLGLDYRAQFVLSDVYALPTTHQQKYDIVFTSYGVLGWLPDMQRWGQSIAHLLKPGGRLVLVEFHPVLWMLDNDQTHIQYSYFNDEDIIEEEPGTYADRDAPMQLKSVSWNHPLTDVLGALTPRFRITQFREYNYSPYNIFKDGEEIVPGQWVVKAYGTKLPLVYALEAVLEG